MEADGQAEAGLTPNMQKAIAYLQDRQANLDRQRQRTIVLDTQGIWVWDEENPKNKGKSNIVLSRQARKLNDQKVQKYSKERRELMETYACHLEYESIGSNPSPLVKTEAASATSSRGAASTYAQS